MDYDSLERVITYSMMYTFC